MSAFKHTPGEWVIVPGDEWTTDIATIEGDLPDGNPAHWNVASVNRRRDEWESNRRLIAAAPELLDTVEELLLEIGRSMPHCTDAMQRIPSDSLRRARAAIAKATGGDA